VIEVWLKNGTKAEVDADSAVYTERALAGVRVERTLLLKKGDEEVGLFLLTDIIGWSKRSSSGIAGF
jgi:pyridoxine/pyridoxamine 5'-phosphate oxidase